MASEKPRKRIVPQQIVSPVKEPTSVQEAETAAVTLDHQSDLQEQAELAAKLLGPGRKIYVKLDGDSSRNIISWNKLVKERGVKSSSRRDAGEEAGPSRSNLPTRPEASNPLMRVIQKLEKAVGMSAEPVSDDDSPQQSEGNSSASEEGGSGDEADQGDATDGGNPTEAEGPGGAKPAGKAQRAAKGDEYDYNDPFFDDTEFYDILENSDKRKPKHEGFFISKGTVERTEEMLAGFEQPKSKARKSKPPGEGGPASEANGAGKKTKRKEREEAADGAGDKPTKKKKAGAVGGGPPMSTAGLSLAQLAAMAGAGLNAPGPSPGPLGGAPGAAQQQKQQQPAPKKSQPPQPPAPPYNPPPEVIAALTQIRQVAAEAPPPPVIPLGPGEKAPPKKLPPSVVNALKAAEALFLREHNAHRGASKWLVDQLKEFLSDYSTTSNLRLYVVGRTVKPSKTTLSLEGLKDLLAKTVRPPPSLSETDDEARPGPTQGGLGDAVPRPAGQHWRDIPPNTRREVLKYIQSQLRGASHTSPAGMAVLHSVVALFPPGAVDVQDLVNFVSAEGQKEAKRVAAVIAPPPAVAAAQPTFGMQMPVAMPAPVPPAAPPAAAPTALLQQIMATVQQQQQQQQQQAPAGLVLPPVAETPQPSPPPRAPTPAAPVVVSPDQPFSASTAPPPCEPASEAPSAATTPLPAAPAAGSGAPPEGSVSDAEIVAMGVSLGAPQNDLEDIMQLNGGVYQRALLRVLATKGAQGALVAEIATSAIEMGLGTWDTTNLNNAKNGLGRQTHHDAVAHLGKFRYALKCFPGVVDIPRPGK